MPPMPRIGPDWSEPLNFSDFTVKLMEDVYISVGIYDYFYHNKVVLLFLGQNDSKHFDQLTEIYEEGFVEYL